MSARGKGACRFALAALVVSFVCTLIPWSDQIQADGHEGWVTGSIEGPLGAAEVLFTADDPSSVPGAWTAPWVESLRTGRPIAITSEGGILKKRGLLSVLSGMRLSALFAVMVAIIVGLLCGVTRWWRLLRVCGAPTSYGTALRLTVLGMFFNLVFPGLTGGDVVKAGLAAKEHPGRRQAAVMAVGLDRVIGLWTLLWIGVFTALCMGEQLESMLAPLLGVALASTLALLALGWPPLRSALGGQRVIAWLPSSLSGLVEALRQAAKSPLELSIAVAWSVANHLAVGLAVFAVDRGIGDVTSYLGCLSASVVASSISAVPIAPAGWGVGEYVFAHMYSLLGPGEAVGYAVSVTYRLCQTAFALLCGVAVWKRGGREDWRDLERADAAESSASPDLP